MRISKDVHFATLPLLRKKYGFDFSLEVGSECRPTRDKETKLQDGLEVPRCIAKLKLCPAAMKRPMKYRVTLQMRNQRSIFRHNTG